MGYKTIEEINQKIREGRAVVVTAEEIIKIVEEKGSKEAAKKVDVVTTGTFGPMCSSGVFINFGHSSPGIRMSKVLLNDVPAYAGIAAVDSYIGATELSLKKGMEYGGAHVIEDLIAGKDITLEAESSGTDCYPRKHIKTTINKNNVNQIYMYNPRNAYQNYWAATNSTSRTIYTYMGTLLPDYGNINYSTSGELSPLLNDPELRTIGIGTRVFIGGATGYVAWEGTQHNPCQERGKNKVPYAGGSTLALTGDLRDMDTRFVRAAVYEKYGVSLMVGVGIPIPILDEDMVIRTAVKNKDIYTTLVDKSGRVSIDKKYSIEELRSGSVEFEGRKIQTAPLTSLYKSREIAVLLKELIQKKEFFLTAPVEKLPEKNTVNKLEIRGGYDENN